MISTTVGNISSSSWGSHHDYLHQQSVINGYDRVDGVRLMRKYTIREKEEGSKEEKDVMAVRSPDSSRVCLDCNTSKTTLWRSGPNGPKTLCNACGIRYRKWRRRFNGDSDNKRKTNTTARSFTSINGDIYTSRVMKPEKLKKREKVVLLLLEQYQQQHQRNSWRKRREKKSAAEGGGGKEVAEAALLLMSLSSGISVHS